MLIVVIYINTIHSIRDVSALAHAHAHPHIGISHMCECARHVQKISSIKNANSFEKIA